MNEEIQNSKLFKKGKNEHVVDKKKKRIECDTIFGLTPQFSKK